MGHLHYPQGMAGTRRLRNSIDFLRLDERFGIRVLILRQGRTRLADAPPSGTYNGIEYTTIGADIRPGPAAILKAPKYYLQGMAFLRRHRRKDAKNIVYVYGYPSTDNLPMIVMAKMLGYKVLFDIVEDIDVQGSTSDLPARIKDLSARVLWKRIGRLADAILVISKHLQRKMEGLVKGKCPVYLYPINIDMERFRAEPGAFGTPVKLFYGGTFGKKDGVENLIDAFDGLAARHGNLSLVLSGRGSKDRMDIIEKKIAATAHHDRIQYMGYLPDDEFYALLCNCDIPCMLRTGSAFAEAGFPFKLGEYLASGKPVVASNISDVGDYLDDRRNAMLVSPDSSDSAAEAIEFLITHEDDARRIGLAGRGVAADNFNAETLGEKLRQILLSLWEKR